jgi:hypothetical protein
MLYKPLKALFTGDHVAKSEESDDLNLFRIYSKQSGSRIIPSLSSFYPFQLAEDQCLIDLSAAQTCSDFATGQHEEVAGRRLCVVFTWYVWNLKSTAYRI